MPKKRPDGKMEYRRHEAAVGTARDSGGDGAVTKTLLLGVGVDAPPPDSEAGSGDGDTRARRRGD